MQRLLDQLNQLREETESYATAGTLLASATEHVDSLTNQLQSVASGVHETALSLRQIGTPEILVRQDDLQEHLDALAHRFEELKVQFAAAHEATNQQQTATLDAIVTVDSLSTALTQSLGQLRSSTTAGIEMLQREASLGNDGLMQKSQDLERQSVHLLTRIDDVDAALAKQARNLQLVTVILVIVIIAATATVLIVR